MSFFAVVEGVARPWEEGKQIQTDLRGVRYRFAIQDAGKPRNLRFLTEFEAEPQSSASSFSKSFSF